MKTKKALTIKEYVLLIAVLGCGIGSVPVNSYAVSVESKKIEDRLNDLEQKVKILDRQLEIEREANAEKNKTSVIVTANGKEGFSLKSLDGDFVLKFRGLVQADSRSVSGKKGSSSDDTFLIRRLRPIFEGTVWKEVDFKFVPDFGEGKTSLQDAYFDFKYFPQYKFRVGKFKVPFGIERLQSNSDTLFTELAISGNLTPNYDIGAALHGEGLLDKKLSYALGLFNGVADNASGDSDIDGSKELAARIFVEPWSGGDTSLLEGLGVGFAVTLGNKEGIASSQYLPTYKTPGQVTFFSYRSDVLADGRHIRYSPQTYYHSGSFGLLAEYILSEQQVKRGTNAQDLKNKAWQVAASYVLTGESASYKGVKPKKFFSPEAGELGAFELVGRISQLNVDDNAFPTFADSTQYAKTAAAWGTGLNWYLNNNVKASLDYDQTGFSGGDPNGDRQKERAILARVQVSF